MKEDSQKSETGERQREVIETISRYIHEKQGGINIFHITGNIGSGKVRLCVCPALVFEPSTFFITNTEHGSRSPQRKVGEGLSHQRKRG